MLTKYVPIFVLFIMLVLSACTTSGQAGTSSPQLEDADSIGLPPRESSELMAPALRDGYVVFDEGVLEAVKTERRILFFYASWCPTCRPMDAELARRVGELPEDLTVIRVNYNDPDTDDAEKALARKYVVTYQHTFVQIDSAGNEMTKWNGGDMDQLLRRIK